MGGIENGGGPRVALVLGAGGVRGCAHAGVIEVLHRAGVQIHLVVGASIGAMFGLGLAAGMDPARISAYARNGSAWQLARFYAGRLRAGCSPIGRMLTEAGQGRTFADLPLPFAVVATDMHSRELRVLASGPVLPAVEASIAIPFVARPVELDGRLYVDGGLLYTVPVHVAREMGADRVIAVRLGHIYPPSPHVERATRAIMGRIGQAPEPAGLRAQLRFVCSLVTETPPPADDRADVSISPDCRVHPNSLRGAGECYQAGVTAAEAALPAIREMLREDSIAV